MGKPSRDKGNRVERRIVNDFRAAGIPARRVPLSGATEYAKGDVEVFCRPLVDSFWKPIYRTDWNESDWRVNADGVVLSEVKARKKFPAWLLEWLGDNDCLFLVEDRQEPLVILRLSKFTEIIG